MIFEKKTPEKCKTCPYALGYVKTLIYLCPKCVGKKSIFEVCLPISISNSKDLER